MAPVRQTPPVCHPKTRKVVATLRETTSDSPISAHLTAALASVAAPIPITRQPVEPPQPRRPAPAAAGQNLRHLPLSAAKSWRRCQEPHRLPLSPREEALPGLRAPILLRILAHCRRLPRTTARVQIGSRTRLRRCQVRPGTTLPGTSRRRHLATPVTAVRENYGAGLMPLRSRGCCRRFPFHRVRQPCTTSGGAC